jgi:NAD(P)-dependent dehydrogenase (short-subunit alcohol dehydrogenase family)
MSEILTGRVALVTGAGAGIGAAIARLFCEAGAGVILADKDLSAVETVCAALTSRGGKAWACELDIRRQEQVRAAFATARTRLGPIEILVNNAGVTAQAKFLDTTPDMLRNLIDTNLAGTYFCAQEAARSMCELGRGAIVNVASHSGLLGSSGRTAYASTKGGVIALTRAMAVDLAPHNIRVNAIAPGAIEVPRPHKPAHDSKRRRAWLAAVPMERYGSPEEVAAVALFLVSDAASYVTGHTVPVDGGFTAAGLRVRQDG